MIEVTYLYHRRIQIVRTRAPEHLISPLTRKAVDAGCTLYLYFRIRCPNCNNPISQLIMMPGGGFFRFSRKLRYCPLCGIDFDTEMKNLPGTAQ